MNNTHKKLHLAPLTLAIASLPLSAHADFISDSKASITARNFYYNHDLRDSTKPAQSKIEEWAQGFIF
uniref:OprD family outer membrane porin n=2 Tax=Pseudomonadota TaxID=1224 RepID=UPI003555E03E